MLSAVLRSEMEVKVSIQIINAFARSGDAWQTGETAEGENRWVKEEKPDGQIHPTPLSVR